MKIKLAVLASVAALVLSPLAASAQHIDVGPGGAGVHGDDHGDRHERTREGHHDDHPVAHERHDDHHDEGHSDVHVDRH